jgi:hypothetical protein
LAAACPDQPGELGAAICAAVQVRFIHDDAEQALLVVPRWPADQIVIAIDGDAATHDEVDASMSSRRRWMGAEDG